MIVARIPPAALAWADGLDLGLLAATRFTPIVARQRHAREQACASTSSPSRLGPAEPIGKLLAPAGFDTSAPRRT